jgi:maltose alpha-D-glucosyltransferase / alpha-amylase
MSTTLQGAERQTLRPRPDQTKTEPPTSGVAKTKKPLWFKEAIIYQLHIKAFCDGNNDGIGDFQGLVTKLDYLKNLGVTAIWLLPFYPSPLRDDGYDIADYYTVNPSYGTLDDFKSFLDRAHQLDLRVITELVLNHTSDQHAWFQKSRRAQLGDPWRDYYVWSDNPNKYNEARIIFKDFETSNWTYDSLAGAYFWHRFFSHQPDVNWDNPEVKKAMFQVVDFWLDLGVDGLRLDAIPYLIEREGTSCENLPETHQILKELREHIDSKYAERMLLAEANQWPDDAVEYFGKGDECHMAFHFPVMPRMFMSLHMEDRYPIIDILEQTPAIPDNCGWAMFLRNHDELTLEMVTEEERDYMYRVYARDPRARINLGIRRRLAPLLGNNRKKVELIHSLLFSMPGSPILYYGDEIGMGDNIYLGDRNGVRTPMQWSADKNAGFSRANPHSLFLPVNIDPEFHYEATNVEVQDTNLSSFLWWMRRVIAIRKRYPALSLGNLQMITPSNHKVLAFTRTYEGQTVLVIINLSRFSQAVELDLKNWAGWVPEDTFGHAKFPVIRDTPYPLTLGPHTAFWLLMVPPEVSGAADSESVLPNIQFNGEASWWLTPAGNRFLDRELTQYIRNCRWFRSKSRSITHVSIADLVELPEEGGGQLLLIAFDYTEGARELYALPIRIVSGDEARAIEVEYPATVIARVGQEGLLVDATADQGFHRFLLETVAEGRSLNGRYGKLTSAKSFRWSEKFAAGLPQSSRILKVEQSNSSVLFEDKIYLKLFRKLEEGINPDLEVTRQLSERCNFDHVPTYLGDIEYVARGQEPASLVMMQASVPNLQDGWSHTLTAISRYYDRIMSESQLPPPPTLGLWDEVPEPFLTLIEGAHLENVRLLGERTADLHIALAQDTETPDFAPEPFTLLHQRSIYQSIRGEIKQTMALLSSVKDHLDDRAKPLAEEVLNRSSELNSCDEYLLREAIQVTKIRIHGDYHLGQLLFTGKDFVILDFEGEPARPIGERRLKKSGLIDVAGMLRSFDYAAHQSLTEGRTVRVVNAETLDAFGDLWSSRASRVFLDAYLAKARGAAFVPKNHKDLRLLLRSFLIHKAVYELRYELNNRPKWVSTPLRGLLRIIR